MRSSWAFGACPGCSLPSWPAWCPWSSSCQVRVWAARRWRDQALPETACQRRTPSPALSPAAGLMTHNWAQAAIFGISVAVGLTPEMLPMVVNANLARGAGACGLSLAGSLRPLPACADAARRLLLLGGRVACASLTGMDVESHTAAPSLLPPRRGSGDGAAAVHRQAAGCGAELGWVGGGRKRRRVHSRRASWQRSVHPACFHSALCCCSPPAPASWHCRARQQARWTYCAPIRRGRSRATR